MAPPRWLLWFSSNKSSAALMRGVVIAILTVLLYRFLEYLWPSS